MSKIHAIFTCQNWKKSWVIVPAVMLCVLAGACLCQGQLLGAAWLFSFLHA